MIEGIFNAGYAIWNFFIKVAVELFTVSPTAANGNVYNTVHTLYLAIQDISIPIAIVFFLIAIIRDVVTTTPDQQIRKLFGDFVKFCVMIGILKNLWEIMGAVMQIADGVTAKMGTAGTYELHMDPGLKALIEKAEERPDFIPSLLHFGEHMKQFITDWVEHILLNIIFIPLGIASVIIILASSFSILSSAIQRIVKPLLILPFSCITVAMASGEGEAQRVSFSYLKTFFGYCLAGAFMVVCVNLGSALTTGLVDIEFTEELGDVGCALIYSVQACVMPIVISGLIKAVDGIIGRFF